MFAFTSVPILLFSLISMTPQPSLVTATSMSSVLDTSTSQPPLFILDFDATITTADTISPLFDAAVSFQSITGNRTAWEAKLANIYDTYSRDWDAFHAFNVPIKQVNFTTLNQYVCYQRSLKGIEVASFDRVSAAGLLVGISWEEWKGLTKEAVEKGDVVIRDGFADFVREIKTAGARWGVVSVNFSESWIRGILTAVLGEEELQGVYVLANEADGSGLLTGYERKLGEGRQSVAVTSDDKVAGLRVLAARLRLEVGDVNSDGKVVYFADSGTDLECVLEGGVEGVIMVNEKGESKLVDTLKRIGATGGKDIPHLQKFENIKGFKEGQPKEIWIANDYNDVVESQLLK